MKYHFISYATGDFVPRAEALVTSAVTHGFTHGRVFCPDDLAGTEFARRNRDILSQPRGAGYWLWKPYLIRQVLKMCQPDDIVFYCDAGRLDYYQFTRFPSHLVERLRANNAGFLLGPAVGHLGLIGDWTKRDCLILMNADEEVIRKKPLLMTWSLWTPSTRAFQFLDSWQHYAEDSRCLTDLPNTLGQDNHPGYREHRHDQSILSILAHQCGAPYLDFSSTLTDRVIRLRPGSTIGNFFYKRPENADGLLRRDNPLMLVREFFSLKRGA
jgi:hypothetical protein